MNDKIMGVVFLQESIMLFIDEMSAIQIMAYESPAPIESAVSGLNGDGYYVKVTMKNGLEYASQIVGTFDEAEDFIWIKFGLRSISNQPVDEPPISFDDDEDKD